jgi:predicted dehydrogenase
VAVYPLTLLTSIFGPARSVQAYGHVIEPDRVTVDGTEFCIQTPDFIVAMIELHSGPLVRLTATFYVGRQTKQRRGSLELHGDHGSLYLSDWHDFDGTLEFAPYGQPYVPVPLLREPYRGVEWSRAVVDMAAALAQGRPHRATGEQAAHVVEIVCAVNESMVSGQPATVHSGFPPPAPLDWAV